MVVDHDPDVVSNRAELLLIDDNPADVRLVREALSDRVRTLHLNVARDGEEALSFLHRTGANTTAPRPELIVLDLQLPGANGREVLASIKSDDELRTIPVVVLASSQDPADIAASYGRHANAYVAKPTQLDPFLAAIRAIVGFWIDTAIAPAN